MLHLSFWSFIYITCLLGFISTSSTSSTCTVCAANTYQTAAGQSSCTSCGTGTYSAGGANPCSSTAPTSIYNYLSACVTYTAAANCNAMVGYPGYYVFCSFYSYYYSGNRRLQEELIPADIETYQGQLSSENFQTEIVSGTNEWCNQCSAGQYCPGTGIGYSCSAGKYQASTAQQSCTACAAGYYQGATGATACTSVCGVGTISQAGASQCSTCVAGKPTGPHGAEWRVISASERERLLSAYSYSSFFSFSFPL